MRIVALCKTFAGEEWIRPMTMSIYPYVDKIVFVNSEISWTGRKGNTCKPIIYGMKDGILKKLNRLEVRRKKHINILESKIDIENKIISLNYDTVNQSRQCQLGYKYIQKHIPCDYVMLIDTDEVWDDYDMQEAIKFIKKNPEYPTYRTAIYTYIKSPYWRIAPIESLKPVSFVSAKLESLGDNARCCDLPSVLIEREQNIPVYYHHFVYVRKDFNTVLEKIVSSHVSERANYVDMSKWIPEVWNKLPEVGGRVGFHPAVGFQRNWLGIERIRREQLPRVLREQNFPIMEGFYE